MLGQMFAEWELVAGHASARVGHHRNVRRLSRHVSQDANRNNGDAVIKMKRGGNKCPNVSPVKTPNGFEEPSNVRNESHATLDDQTNLYRT